MKTVRHSKRPDPSGDRSDQQRAAIAARKAAVSRGERVSVLYREAEPSDLAFVLDSWSTSFRYSHATGPVSSDVYAIEHDARMRRLILRSKLLLVVNPEAPSRIMGWALYETPAKPFSLLILHYIVVRPQLQDSRIGSELVAEVRRRVNRPDEPMFVTHFTTPLKKLIERWQIIYNPYLLEVLK